MTKVHIASRDIYNSETGEFFRPGDVIPATEENEVLLQTKVRRGKKIIPGVEDAVVSTETKIAGSDRAKPGAGQDGRKPAKKKPAAATIADLEQQTEEVEVQEGGPSRTKDTVVNGDVVTPAGGKVQPAPSALD